MATGIVTPGTSPANPGSSPYGSSTQVAQPQVAPFANKGLVLQTDPASLQPGEYQQLDNMTSVREGSLVVRNGSQRITDTGQYGGDTVNIIHSITKLHGTNPDARYIGSAGNIYRNTTGIPASGTSMAFTKVATSVATGSLFYEQRWTGIRYNAGTIGQPWEFFACNAKMLKDNSLLNPLQQWGIVRPVQPAIAALDQITVLPSGSEVITGSGRVNTTISSSSGSSLGRSMGRRGRSLGRSQGSLGRSRGRSLGRSQGRLGRSMGRSQGRRGSRGRSQGRSVGDH